MTVQQVLFGLETDYIGHPYYVSGNAIFHALAPHLDRRTLDAIGVSHGVFVPGQFGVYPDDHSQAGSHPAMGNTLIEPESYADFFLKREQAHSWLLDSKPRDAMNSYQIRVQSGELAMATETFHGRAEHKRQQTDTTQWNIHCYLHSDDPSVLPLPDGVLDGLQFGGRRNFGYGITELKQTATFTLSELSFTELEDADRYLVKFITPYVLTSEHPNTTPHNIPWWWEHETPLRRREEKIAEERELYDLTVVDHGQVVGYGGSEPIKTAKKGIRRIGTHSKYGFGELRVIPVDEESE